MQVLLFFLVRLSPRKAISRLMGRIALLKNPQWLVRPMMRAFAWRYQLRLNEARSEFVDFENLDQMFTRQLKPGIRPIEGDVIHPADATIAQAGLIEDGVLIQAKGWRYSVGDLLGERGAGARYEGGTFVTYYLCPTDYHRVHSPIDGLLRLVRHIPGDLWPVNPYSVEHVKNLFAINERVVFELDSAYGTVAVVMVGATNVGKISVSVGGINWVTNLSTGSAKESYLNPTQPISSGQELGVFHLGSTAVVLFPKGLQLGIPLKNRSVLFGQSLRG
jgi:phosphatidylserine decarboxylase